MQKKHPEFLSSYSNECTILFILLLMSNVSLFFLRYLFFSRKLCLIWSGLYWEMSVTRDSSGGYVFMIPVYLMIC